MNKLTKGAIAGAAGIALLLGGAGTFALWNTTVGVASGTIATGTLAFGTPSAATWSDDTPNVTDKSFDPTTQKIVPGDVVSLTQHVSINATGKNLKAQLAYVAGSVPIPTNLEIVPTLSVTLDSGDATISGNGSLATPYTITPVITSGATGTSVFTVKITFAFPDTVAVGQNEAVDLTGATYSLTQIHP